NGGCSSGSHGGGVVQAGGGTPARPRSISSAGSGGKTDAVSSVTSKAPTNGAHTRVHSEPSAGTPSAAVAAAAAAASGGIVTSTTPLSDFSQTLPASTLPLHSAHAPGSPRNSTPSVSSIAGTPRDSLTIGFGGSAGAGGSNTGERGISNGTRERLPGTPMSTGLMAMKSRLIRRWNSPRFIQQTSLTPASTGGAGAHFAATPKVIDGAVSGGVRPLGSDGSITRTPNRKGAGGGKWLSRRSRDPPEPSAAPPPPPPSSRSEGSKLSSGGPRERRKGSSSGSIGRISSGSAPAATPAAAVAAEAAGAGSGETAERSSEIPAKQSVPTWLHGPARMPSDPKPAAPR
ncbi:unnamed protein product, partial [Sphacelaria rigidula]